VSFSDLEQMPPLKESYIAPEPPAPPPACAEENTAAPQTFNLRPRTVKEYKPKLATRENAKKAVSEIKQLPPRLALYSICSAAAIVLFAIIGMWIHFRSQASDGDESLAAPAQTTVEATAPAPSDKITGSLNSDTPAEPEVTVTPRFPAIAKKKTKGVARVQAAPALGQLAITSSPEGAQVQVDGRTDATWLTPYTVNGVSPGQHTVTIAKPGFNSETRTVDVSSANRSVLVVHLAQLGATLAVTSDPSGAAVYLDGKNTGHATPMQLVVGEKGSHAILVRKEGYLDETTSANLVAGQAFRFAPRLRPLGITDDIKVVGKFNKLFGKHSAEGMTRVSVKTQPKGAQVTANRRMVDKATPVDFMLNPGNYLIDITMPGYKPVHRVVNVQEGVKIEVNENLQPE
jgi:hypothetical protein